MLPKSAKSKAKPKSKTKAKKAVPYNYKPNDLDFEKWQIELRRQFAQEQKFKLTNTGDNPFYSDFNLYNPLSKTNYKVAIRSIEGEGNFCNCMDFRTNSLGTCKHIEYTLLHLLKNRVAKKASAIAPVRTYSSLALRYGKAREIILRIGSENNKKIKALSQQYFDESLVLHESAFGQIDSFLHAVKKLNPDFKCYPDALEYIIEHREKQKRERVIDARYKVENKPQQFDGLIKTKLFPYQQEAVLKAAKAGRYIIADDMGLGKTLQAIAVAELMKREFKIERVLIICPTSLKYQWQSEIEKFTNSKAKVISGLPHHRAEQMQDNCFYNVISYNAAIRSEDTINQTDYDLIILDEAQRIKNWQTQTARKIKKLRSNYCLVLTGTPLENKLDELHSIVEYIDPYQLGLLARFLFKHRLTDGQTDRIIGYQGLNEISQTLRPICIRRTKREVLTQLPLRTDKVYFVEVTKEQQVQHDEHMEDVSKLASKWRRMKFLSEKDRKRLLLSLNCMRMLADSTYILDQKTRHDTKVAEVMLLLDEILQQPDEKVVIFSQWERMGRLIAQELEALGIKYEFLHGGVPADKRGDLLLRFKTDPETKIFLSTDAGSTGLNLQNAAYLINVDLPWNPAVLEQRISRIFRLGQAKPVQIFNFVSKGTIEERMLDVLQFKKNLFEGVLDGGEDVVFMGESKLKQFMSTIEEVINIKPDGDADIEIGSAIYDPKPANEEVAVPQQNSFEKEIIEHEETEQSDQEAHIPASASDRPAETAHALVEKGMSFFSQLNEYISDETKQQELLKEIIHENTDTGEVFLKIKMPDKQAVSNILKAMGGMFKALQG
jgi:SNF2 family DNA or RNA helicase